MEIKKFFIVEVSHPNTGQIKGIKVFTTKTEAFKYARELARETFYLIDVISREGLIAYANYDGLKTGGKLFQN